MRALGSNTTSVWPSSISRASSSASSKAASHSSFPSLQSLLNVSTSFCSFGAEGSLRVPSFSNAAAATSLLGAKSPGSALRATATAPRSPAVNCCGSSAKWHRWTVSLTAVCSPRSASMQIIWCDCTAAGKNTGMASMCESSHVGWRIVPHHAHGARRVAGHVWA